MIKFPFDEAWDRVKKSTKLKNFSELARVLELSQPAVSRQKSRGSFPPDWAIVIELKFGLPTRWILTGEGPRRLDENQNGPRGNPPEPAKQTDSHDMPVYFAELIEWGREFSGSGNLEWLENLLDSCLPAFKKWREQKNAETAAIHQGQMTKKVA